MRRANFHRVAAASARFMPGKRRSTLSSVVANVGKIRGSVTASTLLTVTPTRVPIGAGKRYLRNDPCSDSSIDCIVDALAVWRIAGTRYALNRRGSSTLTDFRTAALMVESELHAVSTRIPAAPIGASYL